MEDWYLYVLLCRDGTYYAGVSTDPIRRTEAHNTAKRGAKYTRSRRPVKLVWSQKCGTKSEALRSEYAFKRLPRAEKQRIIRGLPTPWTYRTPPKLPRRPIKIDMADVVEIAQRARCSMDWAHYAYQVHEKEVLEAVLWLKDRNRRKFLGIIGVDPEKEGQFLRLNDCCRWPLSLSRDGFGEFIRVDGDRPRAHRASYEMFVGRLEKGQVVYHACGNTWCVTPRHLRAGTYKEALEQRVKNRRNASGERHGRAKLTWDDVDEIRRCHKEGMLISNLALAFGVNWTTVSNVVKMRTWKRKR